MVLSLDSKCIGRLERDHRSRPAPQGPSSSSASPDDADCTGSSLICQIPALWSEVSDGLVTSLRAFAVAMNFRAGLGQYSAFALDTRTSLRACISANADVVIGEATWPNGS